MTQPQPQPGKTIPRSPEITIFAPAPGDNVGHLIRIVLQNQLAIVGEDGMTRSLATGKLSPIGKTFTSIEDLQAVQVPLLASFAGGETGQTFTFAQLAVMIHSAATHLRKQAGIES